ncbi:MAG: hypothetical protein KGZ89_00355 [Actinobacteria bacterium]|nr:hypothetical protein [Actinomycetota bacterium]
MTAIIIIINNYLHDVATAVLIATATVLWALDRAVSKDSVDLKVLEAAYPRLKVIAWAAVAWIVVGGIPRTIFFTRFEWDPAVVKGIVPALIVKHVLMTAGIVIGGIWWLRIGKRLSRK